MIHHYDLNPEPFNLIKTKQKTIEMRLNDEKRKLINIGDYIWFTNNETNEKLKTKVLNLYHYDSFEELYKHFDKTKLGYKENEVANYEDMYFYYTKEKIDQYGVLGIEIELKEE